ncbi:MAG TPA: carboxylesterase/lipase family protein [Acidimicrobiales bacterium]|nr:carboxylesterase/lipase family protein [Acidimicrobiales bacterium]
MTDETTVVVETSAGALRGSIDDAGTAVFRGIPFAAPPVGDRRFAPPAPLEPWDGTRDATAFGAASVQAGGRLEGRDTPNPTGMFGNIFGAGDLDVAEDCLFLNLWTPAVDDRKRPVLVWIHGGAFRMGTGALPGYDGAALAQNGDVVVVTINYRLGILGFLYAPELGAANAGLLDQVAALEWVTREIERFGGDPDQVTVFGESAGAKSVECLMAMPAARGLFRRAVMQSTYAIPMDTESATAKTQAMLDALGTDDHAELRRVPLLKLLEVDAATMAAGGAVGGGGGPVVDGTVLPDHPVDAFRRGDAAEIDTIIGTTLDESRLFGAFMGGFDEIDDESAIARIAMFVGGGDQQVAKEALEVYRRAHAETGASTGNVDIALAVQTDRMFRQHSIALAESLSDHNPSTYMYLFAWRSPVMDGKLGACHGIEIPFVFGNLDSGMGRVAGDPSTTRPLSDEVQPAWLSFARTGDPGNGWPPYDTSSRTTIVFGNEVSVEADPLGSIRRFWAEV